MKIAEACDINNLGRKRQYFFVFAVAFVAAMCMFLPYIIEGRGYFIYIGDYNVQQIPFYVSSQEAIRSGNFFWSWETDLGANFIGSYAFYLLGSPFFALTLLFPTSWVAYLMPWLLMLKFGLSAVTSFAFVKRYVKNKNYALLAALIYAFSGFAVFNIFFNHFNEVLVSFPLMLIAIDKMTEEGKKGYFFIAVFINALYNYYFFVAQAVFFAIYLLVRVFTDKTCKFTLKKIALLALEAVLGFAAAAFIVLPAVLTTLQIDRAGTKLDGWALVHYYEVQRYFQLVQAFVLPPELPSQPNFYPDSGGKWSSVAAWLPLFGMSGVIAWFKRKKSKGWYAILTAILIFMAFQPALNSTFQLLSNSFYTRWFFMLTLMLALITALALDRCSEKEWKFGIGVTAGITALIALPVALVVNPKDGNLSLAAVKDRMWMYIIIAAACIILTWMLVVSLKRSSKSFGAVALVTVAAVIVTYGNVVISQGKTLDSHDPREYAEKYINGRYNFDLEDDSVFRIDVTQSEDNAGLFWRTPCIQAFHSVVPGSIFDFYQSIGIKRDVNSKPDSSHQTLRSLLSVKYLVNGDDTEYIYGYTYYKDQSGFRVFTNDNYLPLGFTYDKYMVRSDWDLLDSDMRENQLLDVLVVEDAQEALVAGVLEKANSEDAVKHTVALMAGERAKCVADGFTRDNRGFSCSITPAKDTYVFFSVPYEDGWSATVNGEPAEIVRAGVGFMAVKVTGNQTNTVRFNYMTPGLIPGLWISLGALLLFAVYALLGRRGKKGALLPILDVTSDHSRVTVIKNIYSGADDAEISLYTLPVCNSDGCAVLALPQGEDLPDCDGFCRELAKAGTAVFRVKYHTCTPACEYETLRKAVEFIRRNDEKYALTAENISLICSENSKKISENLAVENGNLFGFNALLYLDCGDDGDGVLPCRRINAHTPIQQVTEIINTPLTEETVNEGEGTDETAI